MMIAAVLMSTISSYANCHETLSKWKLQREGTTQVYDVQVPSTVAGALADAGVFGENLLEEMNYLSVDKTQFDSKWVYTTEFKLDKPSGKNHTLRFEGIGFYADIYLNDTQIAASDTTYGLFCIREYDITKLAKKNNKLVVKVSRAVSGDLNAGYVDWNPRPYDESMGLYRPVTVISTPDVRIKDAFVKPVVDPSDLLKADLVVSATLINGSNKPVKGTFTGRYEDKTFSIKVDLKAGESKEVEVVEHVENPRIWWSRDLGTPEMYDMNLEFKTAKGVSDSESLRFGIRSITSEIDANGYRQFILNGQKVLIKSAGWTDDIFMRDTHEQIAAQMDLVCHMGLNSVRFENIWGKDHYVYDLCDELGLLALVGWSCQWEWESYCGLPETRGYGCINDPRSEAQAIRYFHDQVLWMRNHVSVIGWLTGSDRIPNPRLETEYMKIYNKYEYRPYVCSAKSLTSTITGMSGTKMEGPYEYVGPDFWYKDTKTGGAFGFNTETGVGMNIPQKESVARMVGEANLWPLNKVWNYHCTTSSSCMNDTHIIEEAMAGQYGEASDIDDFMKKAHALDYDATKAMFEAFRCNLPRTTGIVQWMLNSAWPSFYWQTYDYYLVPTAGYFGIKKATKPVQLIYNYVDHKVYVVNETLNTVELNAKVRVYDASSALVNEAQTAVSAEPRAPKAVFEDVQGPCFVYLELLDADQNVVADNFYCIPAEGNEFNWKKADWSFTPTSKYADMTFVSALPQADVKVAVEVVDGTLKVTLTNASDVLAYQNVLKLKDAKGGLLPSVLWSDNFFTLYPGQTKTITCPIPQGAGEAELCLEGWNIKSVSLCKVVSK